MNAPTKGPRSLRAPAAALLGLSVVVGIGLLVWVIRASTTPGQATAETPANGAALTTAPAGADARIDALVKSIEDLRRNQEWAKAEAILTEAIAANASRQDLHVMLAEVQVGRQDFTAAYASYERALASGPRDPDLEFAAGTAASAAGKPERAAEHYLAAQAARPDNWQTALYLAQVQLKLNQLPEAKKNLLVAVRLRDDLAIGWGTLAEIALRENASSMALQHVQKARALEPEVIHWRIIEGRALKREARPEEALQLFIGLDDAQLLEPGVMGLMGECYGLLKRPGDAATIFSRVADRFGDRGELALQAAQWWERAGDNAKALAYAQRAEYLKIDGAAEMVERLSR